MDLPFAYYQTDSTRLAFLSEGPNHIDRCGLLWLGGFKSVMTGEKASRLATWAVAEKRNLVRFDYSGHGASSGAFTDGTISQWLDEAIAVFREIASGPRIVLGSSMGGWLSLLLAKRLRSNYPRDAHRLLGLVLLAPATDMTARLIPQGMTPEEHARLKRDGFAERPSEYDDERYVITRKLLEDGDRHRLLGEAYTADVPVRILHGEQDRDVPWQHGLETYAAIDGRDVTFTLIKGGDHRLCDTRSLDLLVETASALCTHGDSVIAGRKPAP